MSTPANNKEPVWYFPRDSKDDGVCYYIRDGRQAKNHVIVPLTPHPEAASKTEFRDMVFLHREPYGDRTGIGGDMVKDWYGPKSLVDPLLAVQETAGGYSSNLLFPRGTEPPSEDERINVLGYRSETGVSFTTTAWALGPVGSSPGESVIELTRATGSFTGDEVYLVFSSIGNFADLADAPVADKPVTIIRHVSSTKVQIAVPYDATWTPSGTFTADAYEALYILDGYSDSESAPGVLSGLFHIRSFNYALALPQDNPSYDDEMFISIVTEQRVVPETWSRQWAPGWPSAASADAENVIGYAPRSKFTTTRSKRYITGGPPTDPITIPGRQKINMPRILMYVDGTGVWAEAAKGSSYTYDQDWTLNPQYWGPSALDVASEIKRYIVKLADIAATLAAIGAPVVYQQQTRTYATAWGAYYSGGNMWARAQCRNVTIGPCLADGGSVELGLPATGGSAGGGTPILALSPDGVTTATFETETVAWGSKILWDVNVRQSRWDYYIIDALFVTLPAKPYTLPSP